MKKTIRLLVLVMAILMLLPIVASCKKDDDSQGQQGQTTENVVNTEPGEESGEYVSKLPAYDWEGDVFSILGRDGGNYTQFTNFEIWRENMPGDVVGDAVWMRNQALETKYNFVIEQELVSNTLTETQTLYDAQDDVYDLVIYIPNKVFSHASAGYLLDLYGIDNLDFEHPTWSSYVNTELTVGGKLYCTANKFLLQDKARTYTMYYNRELAKQYNLGYLEDHIDNNTWTLEEFERCARNLSFDIDGGGAGQQSDSFGVVAESNASFATLLYGAGFTLGTNNGEEIILTGPTNEMNSLVDAVGKVWFDRNLAVAPSDFPGAGSGASMEIFLDRRSLFMIGFPSDFDRGLNEKCTFELGFMPFPKIDTDQERYYNMMNFHNASVFAIPYTVADPAQVGFYLEAVSEESVNTTYTAYVESKCKVQDSYDELSAKTLDLCLGSTTYDVVACLDPGGIFSIICDPIPSARVNVFVRMYNSKGDRPQTDLEQYINSFKEQ